MSTKYVYLHPDYSTYLPKEDVFLVAQRHNQLSKEELLYLEEEAKDMCRVTPTLTWVGVAPEKQEGS